MTRYILAIDQGTTSTRAILFDSTARAVASAQQELTQHYPAPGRVEHDAEEIWGGVRAVTVEAMERGNVSRAAIAAIGITNQRETTVLWDRASDRPVHPAIVWQDRRTSDFCARHRSHESWLQQRSGLVLDPYFSGTKLRWLLDEVEGARAAADAGRLAFGTIDSFLIWRLTGCTRHVTDVSNASRTMLLNLRSADWDADLCRFLDVPNSLLPDVLPSSCLFGSTHGLDFLPDGIPITGVAGDQQASLFGQGCLEPGDAKCTYGTGAFMLVHTGFEPVPSRNRLLTTLVATTDMRPQYALEGAVFVAGAAVQWLRDGLQLFAAAPEIEPLAAAADPNSRVVFVPALVGLGAPHWVPEAQGTLFGVTRATSRADLAQATLESIAMQVRDLIDGMRGDFVAGVRRLRVDGGAARNDSLMQLQADVLEMPIERVAESESTALGAALLAGLPIGFWPNDRIAKVVRIERTFVPQMMGPLRRALIDRWRAAVDSVIRHYTPRAN